MINFQPRTSMEKFSSIVVTGIDIDRTLSEPAHVYLKLSGQPPEEWVSYFERGDVDEDCIDEETGEPTVRPQQYRLAGEHLAVDCVPEDLEEGLLQEIKHAVDLANQRYRALLEQVEREQKWIKRERMDQRQRLEELQSRLKF